MNITRALRLSAFLICTEIAFGGDFALSDADIWQPLRQFLGTWEGDVAGEPGTGKAERIYRFTLDDRFIQITNKSVYSP
jgi:hypothetical protein